MLFRSLCGLFLQALLMAVNLQSLKSGDTKARRGGIGILLAFVLLNAVAPLLATSRESSITWWGLLFSGISFALASIALFTACALVAAWRSMAEVLAVRQMPWGWPALALIITVYLSGFAPAYRLATFSAVGLADRKSVV